MAGFSLRQLGYFVAAAESGSLAAAARRLNVAQPSISSAIRALEARFGLQLLVRHHASGVTLTPAGQRLLRQAGDLLQQANALEQSARAENDVVAGRLEIGCYSTIAPLFLPRLLAGFRARFPEIQVTLRDGLQDQLVRALEDGAYDLLITYDLELPESLERVPLLAGLKPHVLLPAGHRLARRRKLRLAELIEEPLILLDVAPSGRYFRGLLAAQGLTPRVAYASPSLELVRGLVGQGLGWSILVTRPAAPLTYDGNPVATVALADELAPSVLVACWRQGERQTTPARLFVEHCKDALKG